MGRQERGDITELLTAWTNGDKSALGPLMEGVYERLVRIAASYLKDERRDHTLDAAALVHEAFLRLVQQDRARFADRAHFYSVAARTMRRVLLDHARKQASLKRGRGTLRIPIEQGFDVADPKHPDLLTLDDALRALESEDAELADLVVMRFFGGMKKMEVAEVMGVSGATVARRWRTARAWLFEYLRDSSLS